MKLAIVFIAGLALSGCVAVGTQVSHAQTSNFKKGVTTYNDVIATLGRPNTVTRNADGTTWVFYTYIHSQARPESFIPIVGMAVGGADSTVSIAQFNFDQNNLLTNYSTTESTHGAGTGFSAGTQPRSDQPKALPQ